MKTFIERLIPRSGLTTRSAFFRLLINLVAVQQPRVRLLAQPLQIINSRSFGQICNCERFVVGAGGLLYQSAILFLGDDILKSIVELLDDCNLLIVKMDFMLIHNTQERC